LVLAALVSLGALGLTPRVALADTATVPVFDGLMTFPSIQSPSDPEEYSWEVELGKEQELEQVDEQTVEIFYTEGHYPAFGIHAIAAHDAEGTKVPTSLGASEGSIITLAVHHRAGNPAAGGAPFVYPVIAGEGWEGGFHPVVITGPPTEQELREEREQREKEEREAARRRWASSHCVVPRLKGRSLSAARRRLRSAGCSVGEVARRKGPTARTAKVLTQTPKPGAIRARGFAVGLTLGQ
jgi:hypothetical protein